MKHSIPFVSVLIAFQLLLPSVTVCGQEVIVDDMKYVIFGDEAHLAECLKDRVGDLVVPESVSVDGVTYPVTTIAGPKEGNSNYANNYRPFKNCETIISVKFPKGLKLVGLYGFQACKNLKHVELNEDVDLRGYAFSFCDSLRNVLIPNGCRMDEATFGYLNLDTVEYALGCKNAGQRAFLNSTIGTIILPPAIGSIDWDWLFGVTKVENIVVLSETPPAFNLSKAQAEDKYMAKSLEANLIVPDGAAEEYANHQGWGLYKHIYTCSEYNDGIHTSIQTSQKSTGMSQDVYDLAGRRLNCMPQKGIYIHNRRKVIVSDCK